MEPCARLVDLQEGEHVGALDLARWQFGITTVYHFLFVPITLGTVFLVAIMQTMWVRTSNDAWLRLTKFFGKIFLINFAMGVVTGIVQEFQFGMNWSEYSRFVGDIFGAPLAVEGLLAFFLESTFLGMWIFGWDRLPKKIHLASIWLAAIGTTLSAYFILAANAFMQHPVGFHLNPVTKRAEMDDFIKVLTQNTAVIAYLHTMSAAFLVSGTLVAAVSAFLIMRSHDIDVLGKTLRMGAVVVLVAGAAVAVTGDQDSKIMVQQQPMKMAAAEAQYETEKGADFSLLTIGTLSGDQATFELKVPKLLSWLATGDVNGEVKGINNLEQEYTQTYASTGITGAGFAPTIPLTYWTFRLMIGLGMIAVFWAIWLLWMTRGGRAPKGKFAYKSAVWMTFAPLLGIATGWMFTELGRQPWIVFGQMTTASAVSPTVTSFDVIVSMVIFTVLYGVLAVIEMGLLLKTIKQGLPAADDVKVIEGNQPLTFAY
jgi:cytochrome d ubiquinol oxidase subunit I